MSDLLECPFCGGGGLPHRVAGGANLWAVSCKNCDARPSGEFTEAAAIRKWNTRHPIDANARDEVLEEAAQAVERVRNDGDTAARVFAGWDDPDADEPRSWFNAAGVDLEKAASRIRALKSTNPPADHSGIVQMEDDNG